MARMFTLALALLCSALWLQAQDTSRQTSPGSDTSKQTSIEGCLQRSDGNFILTDSAGITYELRGDTSMLSKHIGHLVKVTGSPSDSGTPSSTSNASSGSSQQQTLTVDKVKHISETCKNMNK